MRRFFRWAWVLLLAGLVPVAAQSGGQYCVRSFQDTNGNGVLDAETEPLLTRGVGIELLNADNVVIASALLERSPNATDGVVCFQNLADGAYAVLVSSADYTATTPRLIEREVSAGGLPVVIEFGAQRIAGGGEAAAPPPAPAEDGLTESFVMQVAFSTVGTVVVLVLMLIIGVVIYNRLRRRNPPRRLAPAGPPRSPYEPPRTSLADTDQMTPFADDTDRIQTVSPDDV